MNVLSRLAIAVVVVLATATVGCESAHNWCLELGVCDPAPVQPLVVDVLCDSSRGSTCDDASLAINVSAVALGIARMPESELRVWFLGPDPESTVRISEHRVPQRGTRSAKTWERETGRWAASVKEIVHKSAEPWFARPAPRRSPIAVGIARIGLADRPLNCEWHVVVISDGREFSELGDWECGPIATPAELCKRLRAEGVFPASELKGAYVDFASVGLVPVDGRRCGAQLGRARRIAETWRFLLGNAGAAAVRFNDGPVDLSRGRKEAAR